MSKLKTVGIGGFFVFCILLLVLQSGNMSADEIANPVENAFVSLGWSDNSHSYSNGTITNATGYYEMNVAEGKVNVSAGFMQIRGNETIMVGDYTGVFNVTGIPCLYWKNITLPAFPNDTATLEGRVYDNVSEKPLQGNISVIFSDGYFFGMNSTDCNASGFYEIDVPPSDVMIMASATGYYSDFNNTNIGAGTTTIDFYLIPAPPSPPETAVVKGYVTKSNPGEAIENASVSIYGFDVAYSNSTFTDAFGYYQFNTPAGNFSLSATAENHFDNNTIPSFQVNESETKWVNVSLVPFPADNAWVEGYIYDNDTASPIPNAGVEVQGSITVNIIMTGTFTRNTTTDGSGYYNVSAPAIFAEEMYPGYYMNYSEIDLIEASADGYFDNASYDGIIEPGDVMVRDVNLTPKPPETCIVKGYISQGGVPPANQPPTVNITSPSDGATVNEMVSIQGTASDSDGTVQNVEVKIDEGSWQTATGTTSWSYDWDTTTISDGSHTIHARSYDGTDYSTIAQVNVTVDNNQPPTPGATLYVGGTGPNNYTSIQDAIDNASSGDTVFVYNDSSPYNENVVVNKSITLIGEDKETTIIDGGGIDNAVTVTPDNVTMQRLSVKNGGDAGILIDYYVSGAHISDCNLYDNYNGIELDWECSDNFISNNSFWNNTHGIDIWYSTGNTFRNNTVTVN
ncbi:MAG: carboxypeptidase regulatory-like domain-containing protein, partial [Candidatus Thermoplasmatota archaeon]|nr:carboxypeptidase regulatory-like domain-containing protein [Candidatus Thermoplasmatota archaeon]